MRADDVASVIDEAIASNPSGSSIFVVHGMGTGRLRAEVHQGDEATLADHALCS